MLKRFGGWRPTAIAQGYVKNSMKNREKIYDNITHASEFSRTNHQPSTSTHPQSSISTQPQPSTSTDPQLTKPHTLSSSSISILETEIIIPTNDNTSPDGEMECDHFSGGFEINEEDLLEIDKLDQHNLIVANHLFSQQLKTKKYL
ncbi:uncharacterized protein LOC130666782 [Microplitis mediator]|uniref:uncharacterized protein LOC130666782 n=1 Tax=Microplitis mediator TaxID=375433 RepID=UPI002553F992|nr:uncharacterized protein LOC130666782 [Microplitis mediator]